MWKLLTSRCGTTDVRGTETTDVRYVETTDVREMEITDVISAETSDVRGDGNEYQTCYIPSKRGPLHGIFLEEEKKYNPLTILVQEDFHIYQNKEAGLELVDEDCRQS